MLQRPFFRRSRATQSALTLALMLCFAPVQPAVAQAGSSSTAPATASPGEPRPKTIVLLAAVGDQFQYVRQKLGVGSRIEPFIRQSATMPDQALNRMVLRGLDRAVASENPGAERLLLALQPDPPELKIYPQDRQAHTMARVMEMLAKHPDRARWDEVMVITPKWLMSERQGMGSKLSGIGLYVQPLASGRDPMDDDGPLDDEVRDSGTYKKQRAKQFVAPFFYMTITVLDAKTLKTIRTDERYDYRKMINSDSAALDIQAQFTPEMLGEAIESFVEASARRLVVDKEGTVDIGPVRTLPEPAPAPARK